MNMKKLNLFVALILALILTTNTEGQIWVEKAKSIPPNVVNEQNYGSSISADSNYAVVGVSGDNNNTGCAYVLFFDGNSWITQAKLMASDGATNDCFGYAVSISGDNIVIGAYTDDDNGADCGSAYVFTKLVTGWTNTTETAKLLASDGAAGDIFGKTVSISGDNIVIGAHLDDDNGIDCGSAYVFTKPVTGWINTTQTAKLLASDGAAGDSFGHFVSISDDDIVIGAMWDDDNGSYSGSAYVFTKPVTGWTDITQTAKLLPSDGAGWNYFGNFVGISGDNIIVGSGNNSAYVFTKPVTGWANTSQTAILTASDGANNDWFANSVSISGNNIILGAERDDDNGTDCGSAYVFIKPVTGWANTTQTEKLIASDGTAGDYFGHSVSISGDNIVIGAYNDDDSGTNSGSAYLFTLSCSTSSSINITACDSYISPSENYIWTTTGMYYDTIPNMAGCDSLITIDLTINPTYHFMQQESICDGNSLLWHGEYYETTGIYYDSLLTVNGCDSIYKLNLTVNTLFYHTDNEEICNGDSLLWQGSYYNSTGQYFDNYQTVNSCDSIYELNLNIIIIDTSITQDGTTLTANASGADYQWITCEVINTIPGEISQSYTATANGSYAVIITQDGCIDTSSCYNITSVGINEKIEQQNITIYPNPTTGIISISGKDIKSIEIMNIEGQIIKLIKWNNGKYNMYIDLSARPKGIYMIKIITKKGITIKKIVLE